MFGHLQYPVASKWLKMCCNQYVSVLTLLVVLFRGLYANAVNADKFGFKHSFAPCFAFGCFSIHGRYGMVTASPSLFWALEPAMMR
jgi:hypothetical protein